MRTDYRRRRCGNVCRQPIRFSHRAMRRKNNVSKHTFVSRTRCGQIKRLFGSVCVVLVHVMFTAHRFLSSPAVTITCVTRRRNRLKHRRSIGRARTYTSIVVGLECVCACTKPVGTETVLASSSRRPRRTRIVCASKWPGPKKLDIVRDKILVRRSRKKSYAYAKKKK